MKFLVEMARYLHHRPLWMFVGDRRFMQNAREIFKKYDPNVKLADQGNDNIDVFIELTNEQADNLSYELHKLDNEWYIRNGSKPFAGYHGRMLIKDV